MAATKLEWVQISRDLWRTAGSRFDIIKVRPDHWCAVDAVTGLVLHRAPTRERCEQWCARQAEASK
jgi:hypothetical protein